MWDLVSHGEYVWHIVFNSEITVFFFTLVGHGISYACGYRNDINILHFDKEQ